MAPAFPRRSRPPVVTDETEERVSGEQREDPPPRTERRRRRSSSGREVTPAEPLSGKKRVWAVGLLSSAATFILMCALFLKRDLTAPGLTLKEARASLTSETMDELSLATLAAQRQEAERELRAMLAAQQVVISFLRADSAKAMEAQLDQPQAAAVAMPSLRASADWKKTASAVPVLLTKRRLPEGAGYTATWQAGALRLQTDDSSGTPKIRWESLHAQLPNAYPSQAVARKKTPPS